MRFHQKKRLMLLVIGLLLILYGCTDAVEESSAPISTDKDGVTMTALFQQEDGIALRNRTIRLSLGENSIDHILDSSGEVSVSGLPRSGTIILSILECQEQVQSVIPLTLSEGAVIDATTGENGMGYVTIKEDTEEIALTFILKNDGSLQCALRLTQLNLPNANQLRQSS